LSSPQLPKALNPTPSPTDTTRREFLSTAAGLCLSSGLATPISLAHSPQPSTTPAPLAPEPWSPRWMLASSLYGYTTLTDVLDQVRPTGATAIDLWPKVHGNQREQLDEIGEAAFRQHLSQRDIQLGCITQFPLGPFNLRAEMELAGRLACPLIVTGCPGKKGLQGPALHDAIDDFLSRMQPHLKIAAEHGVTIAIENHSNSLIDSLEAVQWLHERNESPNLGIAFAPYHLPQDAQRLSECLREIGSSVKLFYAWQHGKGCMTAQPKADELLQLPGRGPLDFRPLLTTLSNLKYDGWIEIFMHPYPRGIPILETVPEVTAEINRSRDYLLSCLD
jgi:sugar phosphate isomerase/epimerase